MLSTEFAKVQFIDVHIDLTTITARGFSITVQIKHFLKQPWASLFMPTTKTEAGDKSDIFQGSTWCIVYLFVAPWDLRTGHSNFLRLVK